MGSLTAGWSTSPPCAKKALRRSTSSMTRTQVNRYWRAKRAQSKEHLEEAHRAVAVARSQSINSEISEDITNDFYLDMHSEGGSASGSLPTTPRADEREDESTRANWWRRSTWAFLNEPPLHEEKIYSYTPQYEIDVRARVTEMETPPAKSLHHTRSSLSIF